MNGNVNMYSPAMQQPNPQYYQYSQSMGRTGSSPLSPEASAFMAVNGLGISYGGSNATISAPHHHLSPTAISDVSATRYPGTAYADPKRSPYTHASQFAEYSSNRDTAADIVRPPRENKRIPIVNPESKVVAAAAAVQAEGQSDKKESDQSANRYSFTPLVQSGAAAKDLKQEELDGIVKRLTEHTPERVLPNTLKIPISMGSVDDESEWSEGLVQEQRQRLIAESPELSGHIDDQTMRKLVNEALMKKLDPLEKMMSMLTDQLKNSLMSQPTSSYTSDADDEDDEVEEQGDDLLDIVRRRAAGGKASHELLSGRTSRNVSNGSDSGYLQALQSQLESANARNNKLEGELDSARRAKEQADAIISDLTQKYIESEKQKTKAEAYVEEINRLKERMSEKQTQHERELREQQVRTARERELHEKEQSMQKDQIKVLQESVAVLNDKLRIAAIEAERAVEQSRAEVVRAKRETEDAINSRATELSWVKTLLDAKTEELDEQRKTMKSADDMIERQAVEELYTHVNSDFLSKLKYGAALSLVSDEFVQLLTVTSRSLEARGVDHKELRRRQNRQVVDNAMPLHDRSDNVPAGVSPLRPGLSSYTRGLKDLKLNRANTIHGMGGREERIKRLQLSREV